MSTCGDRQGTRTGTNRHYRAGESPCDECAAASAAYNKAWRTANSEHHKMVKRDWGNANAAYLKQRRKERYAAGPETYRARSRASRAKNVEHDRARARQYYADNREWFAARNREYYQANRSYFAQMGQVWRETNADLNAEYERRRRSKKNRVLTVPFDADQLAERMSYWGNRCWMCAGPYEAIDHVKPLSIGGAHMLANLRPCCRSCNSRKRHTWPYDTART